MTVQMGSRNEAVHSFLHSLNLLWAGHQAVLLSGVTFQTGVRLAGGDPKQTSKVLDHQLSEPQKFQIKFLISCTVEFSFTIQSHVSKFKQ